MNIRLCYVVLLTCSGLMQCCESEDKGRMVFDIFVREVAANQSLCRPFAEDLFQKNYLICKRSLLDAVRPRADCAPIFPLPFLSSVYKEIALMQAQNFAIMICAAFSDPDIKKIVHPTPR